MPWLILALSVGYLGLLFLVAAWGDRGGRRLIQSPWAYTLSLAVYCSGWTYYGSVGLAAQSGLAFLPIYLGPTLTALLFPFLLHKMLKIARTCGITSIADFIAARYGKDAGLAGLVTVVAVMGAIPYLSLQLKALSLAIETLDDGQGFRPLLDDDALLVTLALAGFAIVFGTRHIDATETHRGMVLAVAFESVVKLLAFLAVAAYAVWGIGGGVGAVFARAAAEGREGLLSMSGTGLSWLDWFLLTLLSSMAFLVLPRQFQVAVIENVDEGHLAHAAWAFPAYLLLINLLVLPVALVGLQAGVGAGDLILLQLPLKAGNLAVATIAYLGGLSAATAMIIVATIALATMLSNDLVIPVLLRSRRLRLQEMPDLRGLVLLVRRAGILALLLLSYLFYRLIGGGYALASIGLISFAAVAQFVPAILAALYWRDANRRGAFYGILFGTAVWLYTLIVPALAQSGWIGAGVVADGPFGIALLRPQALFGLEGLHPVSHALVWSLAFNGLLLTLCSLLGGQDALERLQAVLYVDVYERQGVVRPWRGDSPAGELHDLLVRFIGAGRAEGVMRLDARERGRRLLPDEPADAAFVQRVERKLGQAIGSASAHVVVASVVKGEVIGAAGLMEILDETSQVIGYSQRLEQKSRALEKASRELREANERLRQLDRLKDDSLATVSHELRTPLTSIRSFSEILIDAPDLDPAERERFLAVIVRESERLTRLIDDVLDLSKIESGRMDWRIEALDLNAVASDALAAVEGFLAERGIEAKADLPPKGAPVRADRDRLLQVLVNLLSNAAKFAPEGQGLIRLAVARTAEGFEVRVEDNGPGIPEKFREAVFDKFQQASDTLKDRPKGTGLGLTICRQIVGRFGGRVWIEDARQGGAALCFTLPAT